jgi:hypothetical protein
MLPLDFVASQYEAGRVIELNTGGQLAKQ